MQQGNANCHALRQVMHVTLKASFSSNDNGLRQTFLSDSVLKAIAVSLVCSCAQTAPCPKHRALFPHLLVILPLGQGGRGFATVLFSELETQMWQTLCSHVTPLCSGDLAGARFMRSVSIAWPRYTGTVYAIRMCKISPEYAPEEAPFDVHEYNVREQLSAFRSRVLTILHGKAAERVLSVAVPAISLAGRALEADNAAAPLAMGMRCSATVMETPFITRTAANVLRLTSDALENSRVREVLSHGLKSLATTLDDERVAAGMTVCSAGAQSQTLST